jgi:N-acetylglucosamine-6-phosphate deacetylase
VTGFILTNGKILSDGAFQENRSVVVEDGRIAALLPAGEAPASLPPYDLGGHFLMPGFIDTQVNGGGGILFNDDPSPEAIAAIGAAHRRFGTTGFMPTLISDDIGKMRAAMSAVRAAIADGVPGVLGIHLEGPFLNVDRKGIHEARQIRDIDEEALELMTSHGAGLVMVTLAPEGVPAAAIRRLADAGVIVSAGHSNATAAETIIALDNGLTGFTHLFNAMSQLGSREPGMVGAALQDERGWCGIIVDGHHVDPVALRVALRAKGAGRLMLVTDAMPCVGTDSVVFKLQGKAISVTKGACLDSAGTLAGSNLDMATAVRNAVRLLGLDLPEAAAMASASPADFLGLGGELGRIAPGYRADLVLADSSLEIIETWIAGSGSKAAQAA